MLLNGEFMNKLALAFVFCYSSIFGWCSHNEFEEEGYRTRVVNFEGHDYIIIRAKHNVDFTVIHHPDCSACDFYNVDVSQYQGCVNMQGGGRYTVDNSGSVEIG